MDVFDRGSMPEEASPEPIEKPDESGMPLPAQNLSSAEEPADDVWLEDDLEQLYRQALEVVDAADRQLNPLKTTKDSAESEAEDRPADASAGPKNVAETEEFSNVCAVGEDGEIGAVAAGDSIRSRVTPRQIIEAALFVGGRPLTTKKLTSLFQGEFGREFVERAIEELNQQYGSEDRPYEIRFGEGGYRLDLTSEYEPIRNRVFGLSPKEVKLSREALGVLSLIAYKQPVSKPDIEEAGVENPGGVLRQLLRRQLIEIQRDENGDESVRYLTTRRFLELFGLSHIDELPQADDLTFK